MMISKFYKLLLENVQETSLELFQLLVEQIILLEESLNQMYKGKKLTINYLIMFEQVLNYRVFQYQRETGCNIPSTQVWLMIKKSYEKLKEENEIIISIFR